MSSILGKFVVRTLWQQQCVVWQTHATSLSVQQASHHNSGYLELDIDYLPAWQILATTQQSSPE